MLRLVGREHRPKGLAEGALGKQAIKQVGNVKGHIEGISHGAGAKQRGNQQFAHQAGDAGEQCEQGDWWRRI